MQQFVIVFSNEEEKVNFIREATKKKYDIDLKCGSVSCDGKSMMGVMSLMPIKTNIYMKCNTNEFGIKYDFRNWVVL